MSDSIRMSVSSSDGRGPIFNSVSTPSTFSIIRALMPPYQPGQPQLWPRHCGSGEQCKAHRARRSTHVLVGGVWRSEERRVGKEGGWRWWGGGGGKEGGTGAGRVTG